MPAPDPLGLLRPGRAITGISAVLLPFDDAGEIDWSAFATLVERTFEAGLEPAVNMDTGYGNLLSPAERAKALAVAGDVAGPRRWAAGVLVVDAPGDGFDGDAYAAGFDEVAGAGATPVAFQSFGLAALADGDDEDALVAAYEQFGSRHDRFIAFELGTMFAPFGRIYPLTVYERLLGIPACIGAKHSSLRRDLEWDRLRLRDERRPDFHVFTGNDLAIDMVMYGSDYLLGLSAFAPDLFARRDTFWRDGDPRFYELNDALQYLGSFAFRDPVPAYKHTAAQFLALRGWLSSSEPHPGGLRRPDGDVDVLRTLLARLEALG